MSTTPGGSCIARLAAVASAVAALTACNASSSGSNAPAPIAVDVAHVTRKTIAVTDVLDGQVDPYLQASLAPQQSGTLTAIYANEGDHVHKNAVLAKIDDSLLRANLTQQQGAAAQAAAKLHQAQIQLPITDVAARSALEQTQHAREQAHKQQIADAASVANAKLTFNADRTLLAQGYVSTTAYQQADAAFVAAQETLAADNDKLAAADAAVRQARQSLANTPLQRAVIVENRGAVVQSEGSVVQYRTAVGQTTLTAPFDGVVTSRTIDPGAFASPSQAIFVISQIDPVYVDFNLKDTDLAYVEPGTQVTFATSARPDRRYAGRVASVNAQPATGTLLYRARIVEPNGDFSLRGGLQVSVRVTKDVHRQALTVPRNAIAQNGSTGTIFAIERSKAPGATSQTAWAAKEMTVRLGPQTDDDVAIEGPGLRAGMPIVLGQVDSLHDGAPLRLPAAGPR